MKNDLKIARAVGRGDWHKVIELEKTSLESEKLKQFNYAMIGFAYENLSDLKSAKINYVKALEYDQCCEQALEGLSRIYYNEKDYALAYYYVSKSLHSVKDTNYSVPNPIKLIMAVMLKLLRPKRPFQELLSETYDMDQSRKKWVNWAIGFKKWYEENFDANDKNNLH